MSRDRIVVQVSYQKDKGYKKGVGSYARPDGTRMRRVFWLGHDRKVAERLAVTLVGLWQKQQQQGRDVWPPGDVLADARLFAFADERLRLDRAVTAFAEVPASLLAWDGRSLPDQPVTGPASTAAVALTVHRAVEHYETFLDAKVPHQLSPANCQRQKVSLKTLKAVLGDVPLAEVGGERVHGLVQHVCARPNGPGGAPIGPGTRGRRFPNSRRRRRAPTTFAWSPSTSRIRTTRSSRGCSSVPWSRRRPPRAARLRRPASRVSSHARCTRRYSATRPENARSARCHLDGSRGCRQEGLSPPAHEDDGPAGTACRKSRSTRIT